ncbi:MAG: UDP-glucose--hexose-1-phosphate uridylyltransferase [Elusimicrobiota bacterium]|jgi:UDPglucose--hexose-1-phosphate uridylyltransferase|nr:UDP-glucose--hexose-1-phosphate uridylyltransferase [Elusimicrobiota bacterium]
MRRELKQPAEKEKMIYAHIENLINYALANKLIDGRDSIWARNALLEILNLPAPFAGKTARGRAAAKTPQFPSEILADISFWAAENNLLSAATATYREIFETSLMAVFTRRPSEVQTQFFNIYKKSGPRKATDWFYKYCRQVYYVKADRAAKNIVWKTETGFGPLQLAINLAEPEKDPKEIALQGKMPPANGYPRCLLCAENEGYAGRLSHPPSQNLRLLPLKLNGGDWYFQYSPYIHYNEHSIVLSAEHKPMKISGETFKILLDFVQMFPHYFIGSDADLPLVGGPVLNHEHYQAGRHVLPIEKAGSVKNFFIKKFPKISFDIIRWPMSTLRLRGGKNGVAEAAVHVFETWRKYGDAKAGIVPHSGDGRHNAVTLIARFKNGKYEVDIILRNNRATAVRPCGIFNTSPLHHNIKRENIGLLEAAGLAVLPGRLKNEITQIAALIQRGEVDKIKDLSSLAQHYKWVKAFLPAYEKAGYKQSDVPAILAAEIGLAFSEILYDCGVFKHDAAGKQAFLRFINKL